MQDGNQSYRKIMTIEIKIRMSFVSTLLSSIAFDYNWKFHSYQFENKNWKNDFTVISVSASSFPDQYFYQGQYKGYSQSQ